MEKNIHLPVYWKIILRKNEKNIDRWYKSYYNGSIMKGFVERGD